MTYSKFGAIALVAAVCVLIAKGDDTCDQVSEKIDCGFVGIDQGQCESSGCCWKAVDPNPDNEPWCFKKSSDIQSCPLSYNSSSAPFSDEEVATMMKFFRANINIDGSGAVVAAPDYNTPGGSYYYHWARDGALSMSALLRVADNLDDVRDDMNAYVQWVQRVPHVQGQSDPNGLASILAEPKYEIPNGTIYTGGWCRPQNDGPGLRAKTLLEYALALSSNSLEAEETIGTISVAEIWEQAQIDLDWAAANWASQGCDLWEEIQSEDFFWDRYTTRTALKMGSSFAAKQGDSNRENTYRIAAQEIEKSLSDHVVAASSGSDSTWIFESDSRRKDTSVIAAINNAYMSDGFFGPSSAEAAGTVNVLNTLFCNSFQVNQDDSKAGIPGVLFGRYEGDHYAGGNPWILLTSALAELLYNGASEMSRNLRTGEIGVDDVAAWERTLNIANAVTTPDLSERRATLAEAMVGAGDGVLMRVRSHVSSEGFHLAEQLDRATGKPTSANDLTWSYAATLKAMDARKKALSA